MVPGFQIEGVVHLDVTQFKPTLENIEPRPGPVWTQPEFNSGFVLNSAWHWIRLRWVGFTTTFEDYTEGRKPPVL